MIYQEKKTNRRFPQGTAKRYAPGKPFYPTAEDRMEFDLQKVESGIEPEDGVVVLDGGVMMTTSEILDFSEGTDSKV